MAGRGKRPAGVPTRAALIEFINSAPGKVGRREIARAFGIKGNERVGLKQLLKSLSEDGLLNNTRKGIRGVGRLPSTSVIEVLGSDREGDLFGEPADWDRDAEGVPPRVLINAGDLAAILGPGDRVLAKLDRLEMGAAYTYAAKPIKKLDRERRRLLAIFRINSSGQGGTLKPIDRKQLKDWRVEAADTSDAEDGELVRFDVARSGRGGLSRARIVERLGNPDDQRQISLIAVHAHGIPDAFPDGVLRELDELPRLTRAGREDLSGLPLVTIDPVDARDHDDAVWAGPDDDPRNPGGFVAVVAIADVAFYVRPQTGLSREAERRGNSVYFPDRVVPMLPEAISNDLCSLKEGELRPCLAVRMRFDHNGQKRSHTFVRGLMRSVARLSYQEAQAAIEGIGNAGHAAPLTETVLKPLWKAWRALDAARKKRGPLDLDLPERRIVLGPDRKVVRVATPERLEAHRLIEELMIQANVSAAETLEAKRTPLVYRVHDQPAPERLKSLGDFLETIDAALPKSGRLEPDHFNRLLESTRGRDIADLVSEVVLRSQSQAEYNPENYGHFGLNLGRYAHFTSPIRRYADLIVHRALIRALNLGKDGLTDEEIGRLKATAEAISFTERRAMAAERETTDRLIAAYLADRVGAVFQARISGVTKSGLFVRLTDTGADGLVAISTLGSEYFLYEEARNALVGEHSGQVYRLGDRVEVKLVEAIPTAGALRFEMVSDGKQRTVATRPRRLGKRTQQPRRPSHTRTR
jgi:ribonuclease R